MRVFEALAAAELGVEYIYYELVSDVRKIVSIWAVTMMILMIVTIFVL